MVYVINQNGQPLMPTENHRMVRLLLKDKKAKVVRRTPFTIKLMVKTKEFTQPVSIGVDAGSKDVGISASTETKELYSTDMFPRNDVVKNLSTRREFRRARRNRKTRYRQPRFNNRVHSKHKGWLAPSVEVKIQEHITTIKRICKILPIVEVTVETAEFDLQLIKAVEAGLPVPVGEDYQKGEMLGFYNVRQYVFHRDGYTCQSCGAHGDGVKFEIHHLESRKTGGNAPDNLITLCSHCHELVTNGKILSFNKRKSKSTRDAAFMGIMRKTLMRRLRNELTIPVKETKGYITKHTRETHKLPKSHTIDALCIAGHPNAKRTDSIYTIKPVRNHNRQLHKATILKGGVRKSNQAATYVKGFRLFDKVLYNGQECFIWGRRTSGSMLLRLLDGTKVKDGASYKSLKLLERSYNYLIQNN
jgi:N6-L-threonylcarbamoyladenine synthase